MRKILVFVVMLMSIGIANAINIDAQPTTSCINGHCITEVDLSLYTSNGIITALKAIDLTPAKPAITEHLLGFDYYWNGDLIVFEGDVNNDVYWTFTLPIGDILIDPYWYYTTETVVTSVVSTQSVGRSDFRGHYIYVNNTCNLTAIEKYSATTATDAYVFFENESHWTNTSFSGDNATFSGVELQAGQHYYLVVSNEAGGSYTSRQTSNDKFPYSSYHLTMLNGTWGEPFGVDRTSYALYRIFCESNEAIYYENMLYLNGNQSNATITADIEFNGTATTNLTGLLARVYINGTLSANDTDSATNITNLSVGIYNITGWFGNETQNDTITYWLTVNPAIPTASGTTFTYCTDNNTLYSNITVINDGVINNTQQSFYCQYGCNNITMSCENDPLTNGIYLILVFVGTVVFIIFIDKMVLRGKR